MSKTKKNDFIITPTQKEILKKISSSRTNKAALVLRSSILLRYAKTRNKSDAMRHLGSTWDVVGRWINIWQEQHAQLDQFEDSHVKGIIDTRGYKNEVIRLLSDVQRSGAPSTFTESQKQQIIALASEKPSEINIPITHWSHELLAKAASDTGIVISISSTHVGRFLKASNITTT